MPHVHHIYAKVYDVVKAIMCTYPHSDHALSHWKYVLRWCADCTCINLPNQETDNHYSETTPSIRFHIYHTIAHCSDYGRIPLKDNKKCNMCKQESSSDESKIYTLEKK